MPELVLRGQPVREFAHFHGQQNTCGWYASTTMGRSLAHESWLERTRMLLADFDPRVRGIAAQPFPAEVENGSEDRALRTVLLCWRMTSAE